MKQFIHYVLLTCLLCLTVRTNAQNIVINEFVSDNNSFADSDGHYSDWIELYNHGNTAIDLKDFKLSDDGSDLGKWQFPSVIIPANGFLLIFASSKNIYGVELHTNFKISSSGEALYLSDPGSTIIDQTVPISLGEDRSFGRLPDGSNNQFVLPKASPGTSNNVNNQLSFSHAAGFYDSSFDLTVLGRNLDSIYYTIDGSEPTSNSSLLNGPLLLEERHNDSNVLAEIPSTANKYDIVCKEWIAPFVNIDKAVVLRCASYSNGLRTSEIYTQTYFIDQEKKKYKLPVVSMVTDNRNFFDEDRGIYVPGIHFDSLRPNKTGNFFMRGDDWERPIHIEYFEKDGSLGFKQNAGVRIQGAISRQGAQKSFRLYARSEYGEKYFNYPVLPQRTNDQYKRLVMRTATGITGGEVCLKDELAADAVQHLNVDYQAYNPVVLFLNGEYWGIYSIRDRLDNYYIEYTHNLDKDEIEFFEDNPTHYENLEQFIRNNDLAVNLNFDYVKTQIDLDNFIDTYISEMYFANTDWPGNNYKRWRPTTPEGKWRWIFYDLDFGMEHTDKDMFEHTTGEDSTIVWPNPAKSTFLFRNLLKNEQFVDQFLQRYYKLMDTYFSEEVMLDKLDSLKTIYGFEISRQSERWQYPRSCEKWESDIDEFLVSFLEKRYCFVVKNINQFFDSPRRKFDCLNPMVTPTHINLMITPNPNSGDFSLFNNSDITMQGEVFIFDLLGRMIAHKSNVVLYPDEKESFSLDFLADQSYFLKYVGEKTSIIKKISVVSP